MTIQTWVTTVINAPENARTKIKNSVLQGMSFFKAKWNSKGYSGEGPAKTVKELITDDELKSKDPAVVEFINDLQKQNNLELIGFIPEITYIKVKGPKSHLESMWEHPFGSPTLLYAHKTLPMLIIAGPDIMFNDSMVRSIKSNNIRGKVFGVTG